jgi:hypothetical protein
VAFTRLIETLGVGKYCHFADSRPFFAEDSKEVLDWGVFFSCFLGVYWYFY